MDMQQAQALIVDETRTRMAYLITPVPIQNKAENLRDLCRLFQALGICKLITEADVTLFREHLVRSAHARRYYLRKSHEEHNREDRFLGLSRVSSMFDAVVAGETGLARDIASMSVNEWHETWEYEDDFCYFLFVHGLVLSQAFIASAAASALVTRFERALEGQPSPRLALCKALQSRDAADFRDAFERLVDDCRTANNARRARITEYSAEAIFWPGSFVSIESLAWLRFAAMAGIEPSDQFALCPEEARRDFAPVVVPDLFDTLDQVLSEE
jgi:hypothetical protein